MKTNISYEESVEILQNIKVHQLGFESVFFGNALNRVLSQDIVASDNMPKYATSAMDGFAFRYEDLELLLNKGLAIQAINKAGEQEEFECQKGACVKTFTGSRMPKGCDALVLVEYIKQQDNIITLCSDAPKPQKMQWIREVGENYKKGEILLRAGSKITPFEIGLLAELNYNFVQVYKKPKIAILSGGDEIIEVGQESRGNAIRSVNNHLLKALAQNFGAEVFLYPLLQDDKAQIKALVLEALTDCDILITTGGASKGDFDYTQEVIKEVCDMQYKGARIKPGKPMGFGIYQNRSYVFSLSGYPNACATTFLLFARYILQAMLGMPKTSPTPLKAKLVQDIRRSDTRMEFRICNLRIIDGYYEVGFWNKKALQSSVINNFDQSSALILLAENGEDLQEGTMVDILPLSNLMSL